MRLVHAGPAVGLVAEIALLGVLTVTIGLSGAGWWAGMAVAAFVAIALSRGLALAGADRMGPADWVTLLRATLVGGVTGMVVDSFVNGTDVAVLVGLSAVALALDSVDGWVARRTRTESAVGARFDYEVDAYFMLVLCFFVAPSVGWWVLVIGLARYAFVAAGWLLPWMRGTLPPRYWRKVVAATQGIVLTVVASGVLPAAVNEAALIVAAALLAESFGRDVWWLWRHRACAPSPALTESARA